MTSDSYQTRSGLRVLREARDLPYERATESLTAALDVRRGVLFSSSFEFPGRYTRWDVGFTDPPLVLTATGRDFTVEALNARGEILLPPLLHALHALDAVSCERTGPTCLAGTVRTPDERFDEEMRSRQPSVFSVLRAVRDLFGSDADHHLGLYGAFGYDLVFQFEPMPHRLARAADQRDLVLFLPDEILVVDHMGGRASLHRYDFVTADGSTVGLPRDTAPSPYEPTPPAGAVAESDHAPGEYAAMVERARAAFARGDLFEAVLGQVLAGPCAEQPSEIFKRLRRVNPAPYGALMNLGEGEFLVGASPEMFVRVEGTRIETCPISGTVRRGRDALEDAERVRELLNSAKDEAELTMCTDVDRNDKSRVCEPGSVKVIGRRQIEMYSRLIHTVDHVEGVLRPEFDALDGFLSHAWAVTVTGAPKRWAIRFIEQEERSARRWYGGAIGWIGFDGNMNTGLTLRTIRMKGGIAEVRVGATLLHDSVPEEEEAETRLKASAMFAAISAPPMAPASRVPPQPAVAGLPGGAKPRVLLVDHEDSFVHTLAGYLRAAGAEVATMRAALAREALRAGRAIDLLVLSPGPGRPSDFAMGETLDLALHRELPIFGVCLGLQGLVEHFGGALDVLVRPMHGKPSQVRVLGGRVLGGLPERFTVGRYHSLHARRAGFPDALRVTAETEDGVIMAIEHVSRPIAAVQFHPESVMTPAIEIGAPLIAAALRVLARDVVAA
jgi:anthranilate synthase